jgi:endoglycosylceramidase
MRALFLAACLALAACAAADDPTAPPPKGFTVRDGFPVAPDGRVLLLRGLNYANDHKFPDAQTGSFFPAWASASDFTVMRSYGFNSVRLLITWEAVEPRRGTYDERYLDALAERLDWAAAAGLYVILDMHQDVYARAFGGDGAPAWAVETGELVYEPVDTWYLNFGSPAVQRAMDNFFADEDELLTHFVNAWVHVAARVRAHPALLGYDLLNEPFPGSKALNVDQADTEVMNPFYERLLNALAAADGAHLFFVEPNAVRTNVFAGAFPSKLARYPAAAGRLVFSPHLYDPVVTSTGRYDGGKSRIVKNTAKLRAEAARLGAALWVGEWSVWDGKVENGAAFLHDQLAAMDGVLAGWSFWNFSLNPADKTSPTQTPALLDELARPQLDLVAGTPTAIACAARACRFTYVDAGQGETRVVVPDHWAVNPVVKVSPARPVRDVKRGGLRAVLVSGSNAGEHVSVEVSR